MRRHHFPKGGDGMKNAVRVFSFLCIMICFAFLLVPSTSLPAQSRVRRSLTAGGRAASVQKQIQEHQYFLDSAKRGAQLKAMAGTPSNAFSQFKKVQTSSTIFFQDDMESGTNGWTVVSPTDSAAWHLVNRNDGGGKSWKAGTYSGTYATGARVYDVLISPQISLSGAMGQVTLRFAESYYTELGWDFCMVDVTTDSGTTWTHLRGGYGESVSGDSHYWKGSNLDLTPYVNQTINLRFVFDTGDSLFNNFDGWSISNVIVFDQTAWVTGTIFFDQNKNGIYNTGESTITDLFSPYILTQNGTYWEWYHDLKQYGDSTFNVPLPLGSYFLVLTDRNFENWYHPWITTTPETLSINLSIGGQVDTINTGYYRPPCIMSGRVFQDLNHNGHYNNGEPAFTDPVIDLEQGDLPNVHLLAQTHVDSTGQFSFQITVKSWMSRNYRIAQYDVPGNWIATTPNGDDPNDVQSYSISIGARDTVFGGLDFGSYKRYPTDHGVIRGHVFNDLNGNGVQDEGEPMMSHCSLSLGGYADHFPPPTWTDSAGRFSFTGLPSARYLVALYAGGTPYGWQQTFPVNSPYWYDIQLGTGEVRDSIIFGTYKLPVGTVRGHLFYDTNRNGAQDPNEPSLAGSSFTILGPNDFWRVEVETDHNGDYSIDTLPIGVHILNLTNSPWMVRSIPPSPDTFALAQSQTVTKNFGVYDLSPCSISGSLYNDLNGNGVRDPNEPPVKGVTVYTNVYTSTLTNDSGNFRFDWLWAGYYKLTIPMTAGWRQTQPASLQPYSVKLGDEQNLSGYDFGVTKDSTFNVAFRTFLPESLISDVYDNRGRACMPMPTIPVGTEETFGLVVPQGGLNGLHIEFGTGSKIADSIWASHLPPPIAFTQRYKWEFKLSGNDTLADGEEVMLYARYKYFTKRFLISRYWWEEGSIPLVTKGPKVIKQVWPEQINYKVAMPNLVNIFQSLDRLYSIRYAAGLPPIDGLEIGLVPGPYSVYFGYPPYKSIWSSLTDRYRNTHKGRPRCLDMGGPRTVNKYPPKSGNNILFAEQLALKANLLLSDYAVTQAGLGSLIFHGDSTNPFNGLSVRAIGAKIDTAMSNYVAPASGSKTGGYCACDTNFFDVAYRTIRMIDSAFCGRMDTIGDFTKGQNFALKPVRSLSDVPFLSVDSNFSSIAHYRSPEIVKPLQYRLQQNYPNPFNPLTTIQYDLPGQSKVVLKVYNILGQEVVTLVDEVQDAGFKTVEFNASRLASGVYIVRLAAGNFTAVKKMVFVK